MFCNKQYTGKSETAFNLSLNKHRKDVNKQKSLQADQNFWLSGHNFNKHSKFTLIEQLNDNDKQGTIKTSAKKKTSRFLDYKTLQPYGFNAEMNFPNP